MFFTTVVCYSAFYFISFSVANAQNPTFLETFLDEFAAIRTVLNRMDHDDIQATRKPEKLDKIQKRIDEGIPFPCPLDDPKSNSTPTSVHKLKPGDIDVVGAIGDSLTSGFAVTATNVIDYFVENRGMAFPIDLFIGLNKGGQRTWRDYLTLPNILKEYNPKLFGFSTGPSVTRDRKSQFNVAEVGATSSNVPYMTKVLIKRIIMDKRVDLKNHWKMITIFIGSNDFCVDMCYYSNAEDILDSHRRDLIGSLRLLRDNLPRTFVNVVLPPDISVLRNFTVPTGTCYVFQRVLCPCFIGERFKPKHNYLKTIIEKFRRIDLEVANYDEFDRDDFTVVAQPMLLQTVLPTDSDGKTEKSYFSIDCFHFSQKGNALVARALWNNILEAVQQKSTTILADKFKCPTKDRPYLATRRN